MIKWYEGKCCSGHPNCIHKPVEAFYDKAAEAQGKECEHLYDSSGLVSLPDHCIKCGYFKGKNFNNSTFMAMAEYMDETTHPKPLALDENAIAIALIEAEHIYYSMHFSERRMTVDQFRSNYICSKFASHPPAKGPSLKDLKEFLISENTRLMKRSGNCDDYWDLFAKALLELIEGKRQ